MDIRKGNLHVAFLIGGMTYNAISINNELNRINDQDIFSFDLSKKSKIDINDDADSIVRSVDKWRWLEFNDEHTWKNIYKFVNNRDGFNMENIIAKFNLPNDTVEKVISSIENKKGSHRIVLHLQG